MTATAVDKRGGPALFYHLQGGKTFGPDGVTNTYVDVMGLVGNGTKKLQKVGEMVIGTDGFMETMFFLNGKLVKLKMTPGDGEQDGKVFIEGVWG